MPPEENQAPDTPEPAPEPSPTATDVSVPVEAPAQPQPETVAPEQAPEPVTAQIPASEPMPATPEPESPPPSAAAEVDAPKTGFVRDLLIKARATIQFRKTKKLEKILSAVGTKGKITNDEVEKLLHVSDATATRYLSALVKNGKLKQEGKTGAGVAYVKF